MKPLFSLAKRKARKLLQKAGVVGPPVPVADLAALAGAEVQYEPFDGELSGMIMRREGRALIGINTKDSLGRQRFSLAHELDHLLLHRSESFHLDSKHPIRFRDARSSTGEDVDEVEANQFAAELLMPEGFLARDVQEVAGEEAEVATQRLAERYQVSDQAMSIRLSVLGYIR
jgi:Zn-dependent peptidase ImmA (M78 family)